MPLTNFSNITTATGLLREANVQTGGWFWTAIDFLVFSVIFITLSTTFGWESAFFGAGFVAIIISVFLLYMNLITMTTLAIIIGSILLIFIFIMWASKWD